MKGGKRKLTREKILSGTARPDRLPENEPIPEPDLPVPPSHLVAAEKAYFLTMVERLDRIGVASATDTELITQIALRLWEIEQLTKQIRKDGRTVETFNIKTGLHMLRSHPAVAQRNEAQRHLHALLAECGLTPAARSKVSAKGPKASSASPYVGRKDIN